MGVSSWTNARMAYPGSSTFMDLKRHGANSFKIDGEVGAGVAAQILGEIDAIRRGFASFDPRSTGLVSEKDFRKVLYLEGSVPYNDISIILASAPAKGGFVGYDTWLVDFLNRFQPADSSFRIQKPADFHPAQEVEEVKRRVIENAPNLLSSLRMIDMDDMGYVPIQDFRGALYLKLGLTAEQVDGLLCGIQEGDIDYPAWLSFFTTNSTPTSSDVAQFIRYGGSSTSGSRAPELSRTETDGGRKQKFWAVSEVQPQTLPPLYNGPG